MQRSATHADFTIHRIYAAPRARVFAALSTPEQKARWFHGPAGQWTLIDRALDFRVGGRELLKGAFAGGPASTFNAHFSDIVPDERIIYSYSMQLDERLISVSLATVELKDSGAGTKLIFTEQAAFLDGFEDNGGRERGTGDLLDKLGEAVTG
jgi:uncharacterized protein YndB with AHSA1/START domain